MNREYDNRIKDLFGDSDLIKEILQHLGVGMLITSDDVIVWAGGKISEALGLYKPDGNLYNPNELFTKRLAYLFPSKIANRIGEAIRITKNTGESQSIDFEVAINGETEWHMVRTFKPRNIDFVVCVCKELTGHESDRIQIALTETLSKLLFNIVADILVAIDKDGSIVQVSESFSKLVGDTNGECIGIGKRFQDFIDKEARNAFLEKVKDLLNSREPFSMETKIQIAKLNIPIEIRGYMIAEQIFHEDIIWLLIRDISERKQDEKILKLSAETATLYLDILGHDIRNYMQAIMSGIEILSMSIEGDECRDTLSIIIEAVEKIQSLIKRSQATKGFLEEPLDEIDCVEVIRDVVSEFKQTFNDVIISETYAVKRAPIHGDRFASIIFKNIIENAITYNSNSNKRVWIILKRESRGYSIFVEDNGPGLKKDRKTSLLDPTRRYGGIGIHQAKSIIVKYGGTLEVDDRVRGDPSQGTSFKIWLPEIETGREW